MSDKEWIWQAAEAIALEKYYVELEGEERKLEPAFLTIYFKEKGYGLFVNGVGLIKFFSSRKKLHEYLKKLVENANFPLKLWKGLRARKPFAINTVQRVTPSELPCKVFNIPEWEREKNV